MKSIIYFKNGDRIVGNMAALISPQPLSNIASKIDLDLATEEEIQSLEDNPYDDLLIETIQSRSVQT